MPDNYFIAEQFEMLSKLMDIHGENSFKAKSYASAAFNIEKIPVQLALTPFEKYAGFKGIGDSAAKKIQEIVETGKLQALQDIAAKTPEGVIEMLNIKGLGPKKIATIWHEMEIESLGELLYACNENRLLLYKGFGEKTQKAVQASIEFYLNNKGSFLYAQVLKYAQNFIATLQQKFTSHQFLLAGEFRKQSTIINKLTIVTTIKSDELINFLTSQHFTVEEKNNEKVTFKGPENLLTEFIFCELSTIGTQLFFNSASESFIAAWVSNYPNATALQVDDEQKIFDAAGLHYIPACLREKAGIIEKAKTQHFNNLIQPADIKGIIHNHSNWSDGINTIEEMASACIKKGYEYLVISDHSKTAAYANGLQPNRVLAQHALIDELNKKFAPFKIFKSIESDILSDGALDYDNEILKQFDLVIASIHSNLSMSQDKAMMRLLNAINNPYTTILGHMTGRLLLSRNGYPINHEAIIDACVANNVVIELNAHPRRLDIDWSWIDIAIDKGAIISIDPDAHTIDGFNDVTYGVLAAQKAGVTKQHNLSSFSLAAFEIFLQERKTLKKI
jgi:DNA polymerase (family X)